MLYLINCHIKRLANYGIDAPPVIIKLTIAAIFCIIGAITISHLHFEYSDILYQTFITAFIINAAFSILMLYSSLFGKKILRNKIITQLSLRGTEHVLDIGCGRGLLLIAIAKKLTGNTIVEGLDLWRNEDLSNNNPEKTHANAISNNVQNKINITNGDMMQMPYPDGNFDIIVSNFAIHNLKTNADRQKALEEINRVAKPGSRIIISDFRYMRQYRRFFQKSEWIVEKFSWYYIYVFPPAKILIAMKGTK